MQIRNSLVIKVRAHTLAAASNYGVFIIIIVTLQHAQLGVEEVI